MTFDHQLGRVFSDLRIGADVGGARSLIANSGLSSNGMMLAGQGFVVSRDQLPALGLGTRLGLEEFVGPYVKGREFNQVRGDNWVLDFHGLSENELKSRFPEAFQYVFDNVWPERSVKNDKAFRKNDGCLAVSEVRFVLRLVISQGLLRLLRLPNIECFNFLSEARAPTTCSLQLLLRTGPNLRCYLASLMSCGHWLRVSDSVYYPLHRSSISAFFDLDETVERLASLHGSEHDVLVQELEEAIEQARH